MRLISATEEVRRPNSPIAHFLHGTFPDIGALSADFDRQLTGATTLVPAHPDPDYPWSLVGTAIDYRIRFYLEVIPISRLLAFRSSGSWVGDAGASLAEQVIFKYGPDSQLGATMPRMSAELFESLRAAS
jgi:hypothetical protein